MHCSCWYDSLEESEILIKRICQDLLDEIILNTQENAMRERNDHL